MLSLPTLAFLPQTTVASNGKPPGVFFSVTGRKVESMMDIQTVIRYRVDYLSSVGDLKGKISVHRRREM